MECSVVDDIVVAVHVDDNIVGIGGPGFVVVDVAYARDVVVLVHVLWNVSVVDDIVVAVHVDDNIVGIGGPGFVIYYFCSSRCGICQGYCGIGTCIMECFGCG